MEAFSGHGKEDDQIELPPGFRFHPTDEELITHYLSKRVVCTEFSARAIGDVDLNKVEPWDLPLKAKMGGKEWYFFCVRDKKYPTGLRTNRATAAGYWKATGKDKEIFRGKSLVVGMKKTLVFYKGRAPKGEKTNWVMHEYRLEGKFYLPKSAKNEWVICRVFQKSCGGMKIPFSGLERSNEFGAILPPLMDSSPYGMKSEPVHVPCFSNPMNVHKNSNQDVFAQATNPLFVPTSNSSDILPRGLLPYSFNLSQASYLPSYQADIQVHPVSFSIQDQVTLKGLLGNNEMNMKQSLKTEEMVSVSRENSSVVSNLVRRPLEAPSSSLGPIDLDHIWNF